MASKFFYGRQKTLRAVRPFTIGFSSGATYTWTVNGKTLIYTAVSGDDATSVALALANLGSSSVEPEHSELEFSSSAAVLTATGPTDGGPFTASGSATAGSFTSGTAITGTSPNDLTDTANWSGAALPGNNDTVTFPKNAPNVRYNLAGMTATGLTIIREAGGPRLGLPDVRSDGKLEYRSTRMVLASCASALIYLDGNEVAQSVRLDCGTFATIVEIVGVGPSAPGAEVVEVVGLTTNGEIRCNNGSVASCTEDGEAEIVTVLNATNSTLRVGPWGTATTINVNGQTAVASIAANFTTLNVDDFAQVGVIGSATGRPVIEAGTVAWISTGNPISPVIASDGVLTFDQGTGAVSIAGINEVQTLTSGAAATGGTAVLRVPLVAGGFANTGSITWDAADATLLANINAALDAATGVAGGIVATGAAPDTALTFTFSGTGYAGLNWDLITVVSGFTSWSAVVATNTTTPYPAVVTRTADNSRLIDNAKRIDRPFTYVNDHCREDADAVQLGNHTRRTVAAV